MGFMDFKTTKTDVSGDAESQEPASSNMPDGDAPHIQGLSRDEADLVALGYKQEFKREFSLWTTFCVSFAVLGLLPSFASTLVYGMGYAGRGGMVYGWLIALVFIQCIAMGMAELCSSMPTRYVERNCVIALLCDSNTDLPTVEDFTTLRPFWHPLDGDPSLHGSPAGRIGSVKSLQLHPWTTL